MIDYQLFLKGNIFIEQLTHRSNGNLAKWRWANGFTQISWSCKPALS